MSSSSHGLSKAEIARFSRQILVDEVGVNGQRKLRDCSILIVGCGGLGCPAAIYLASSGVGRITLVDGDTVSLHNLHRQIAFVERHVGQPKAETLAAVLRDHNSSVQVTAHNCQLRAENALSLVSSHDVVLDCTDNVASRYLVSDACVLTNRPLVSASALRWEAQLSVYHLQGGPCYRCVWPRPPPAATVTNCSDGGVVGPAVGVASTMQAVEAIKIAIGHGSSYSSKLWLFDGLAGTSRVVTLRGRRADCDVCGDAPTIRELDDYEQLCGSGFADKTLSVSALSAEERVSAVELSKMVADETRAPLLVDVRPTTHFEISAIPAAINVPLSVLSSAKNEDELRGRLAERLLLPGGERTVVAVCRRGNDSQLAVPLLRRLLPQARVVDLAGGLEEWAAQVDADFPIY